MASHCHPGAAGREPHDITRKAATTEGHADIGDIA
jgi:hypothetical protein